MFVMYLIDSSIGGEKGGRHGLAGGQRGWRCRRRGDEPLQITVELGAFGEDVGAVSGPCVEPPGGGVFGF